MGETLDSLMKIFLLLLLPAVSIAASVKLSRRSGFSHAVKLSLIFLVWIAAGALTLGVRDVSFHFFSCLADYREGLDWMEQEEWSTASWCFGSATASNGGKSFRDSEELTYYCEARADYAACIGRDDPVKNHLALARAANSLRQISSSSLSGVSSEELSDFRAQVTDARTQSSGAYSDYLQESGDTPQTSGGEASDSGQEPGNSSGSRKDSQTPDNSGEISTDGYFDPEDFFIDYEDEFFDYEDAEEYFYDHQ